MFQSELSYQNERRSAGATQALAYYADINEYTQLHGPKEGATSRAENDPKPTRICERRCGARPFGASAGFAAQCDSGSAMRLLMSKKEFFLTWVRRLAAVLCAATLLTACATPKVAPDPEVKFPESVCRVCLLKAAKAGSAINRF